MKYSQFLWSVETVYGALGSSYLVDLYLPDLGATPAQAIEKGVAPKTIWEQMLKETEKSLDLLNIYRWDVADIKDFMADKG